MERSKSFSFPRATEAATFVLALSGCHAEVPPIRDAAVDAALFEVIRGCENVRKEAKAATGDANHVMISIDHGAQVQESCHCQSSSCDYLKGKKVETTCASGIDGTERTPCDQYDVTSGSLTYFDDGEEGFWMQAKLSRPEFGLRKEMWSDVSARIKGRDFFHEGTCDFSDSYFDGSMMQKPRGGKTREMRDCVGVEVRLQPALERIFNQ